MGKSCFFWVKMIQYTSVYKYHVSVHKIIHVSTKSGLVHTEPIRLAINITDATHGLRLKSYSKQCEWLKC